MKMAAIAGQIGVRPADATGLVVREFGTHGTIRAQALEDGRVLLAVQGHDGLSEPGDEWQKELNGPHNPPIYAVVVEPSRARQALKGANRAADDALEAEARAKQAAEDLADVT